MTEAELLTAIASVENTLELLKENLRRIRLSADYMEKRP